MSAVRTCLSLHGIQELTLSRFWQITTSAAAGLKQPVPDVLAPGIDRRNNYFTAKDVHVWNKLWFIIKVNMRYMKNLLKYTLITSLFIMGGLACTKLDENLKDTYTKKFDPTNIGLGISVNKNLAQPADGLQGAFNTLLTNTASNGGFFAVQEGGTDEAVITQKGGDWYDGGLYIRIHQHQFTPQTWRSMIPGPMLMRASPRVTN